MVGHDDKGIQFSQREMVRDILPTAPRDFARVVQMLLAVDHVPEQGRSFVGAYRHEIRPWLGIIVSIQADGTAMMSVWVVSHLSSGTPYAG
jgi:hypothetical protein